MDSHLRWRTLRDQNTGRASTEEEQALFDHCSQHLLEQNRRAVGYGQCLYRGPDGTKCALGAAIADLYYDPSLERCDFEDDAVRTALRRTGWQMELIRVSLLECLQMVHDEIVPEDWVMALRDVARSHSLCWQVVWPIPLSDEEEE